MNFRNKLHFIISIMICASANVYAENVEQIYMKSGSVVEGYIAEQKPGKYISIQSTKATIVVNSDTLQNRIIDRIPQESLSEEWQQWAEENGKYIEDNGVKKLELSTLEFSHSKYSKVYILERGSLIKFIDISPNRYQFVWGDMYRTVKNKRPDNLFSGVSEVLILNDNTKVEGQVVEQFPGRDLKIQTKNDEILSYKFSQIKQIETKKLLPKLDLWSQIQLLDKIQVRGEQTELIGFISSRTLGKELVIEFEDGTKRTIKQNKVMSYAKIPNKKYQAIYDTELDDGEIYLNGTPAYLVDLKNHDQYILLGDTASTQVSVGASLCLDAKLPDVNTPIILVKAHEVTVTTIKGKKKENKKCVAFTFQDLVQMPIPISREISPLGNIRVKFEAKEVGDYVLYIQGQKEYIVINVVEDAENQ